MTEIQQVKLMNSLVKARKLLAQTVEAGFVADAAEILCDVIEDILLELPVDCELGNE